MNLFQLAVQNDPNVRTQFDEMKNRSTDGRRQLEAFTDRVQETGRVSINMRPSALTALVNGEGQRNVYEWADEQSRLSLRPKNEILQEKLGAYFRRRIHFDDAFDHGRQFRYGALNIGGLGPQNYGQFCTVLRSEFLAPNDSVAYLMRDSLRTYMQTEVDVNTARLQREVTTHSHVQYWLLSSTLRKSLHHPKATGRGWCAGMLATSRRFS